MLQKRTFAIIAVAGLAVCSGAARAQFGPAIGPPPGGVPASPTPSPFPPITAPPPPPGWMGSGHAPTAPTAPASVSYKIYFRESPSSPWTYYATFNSKSDVDFATKCLRARGYEAYYR